MMGRAVILTGATSFIGRAVARRLLAKHCEVIAVIRPGSSGRKYLEEEENANLSIVELNLGEISRLREVLNGKNWKEKERFWLHLGWEGAGSNNRANPELQKKNIGYAIDALKTAGVLGCTRFLFSGSQAEYGICTEPMREEDPCHPVSEYGKNKVEVFREASALAPHLGITYLHTRIFSVYGPGDHPWSLIETCLDAFLNGGHMELGACTQMWNFLYVEDAADALVKLLLGNAPCGVYNVAGEDTRPLRSYLEELHTLCGGKGTYRYGVRPPNAEGVVSLIPVIEKLKQETGWRQSVRFDEGIRRMIALRGSNES